MVNPVHRLFLPFFPTSYPKARNTVLSETVVAVSLGVIALAVANTCERQSPMLNTLFRCAAVGMGLVWLFKICYPGLVRPYSQRWEIESSEDFDPMFPASTLWPRNWTWESAVASPLHPAPLSRLSQCYEQHSQSIARQTDHSRLFPAASQRDSGSSHGTPSLHAAPVSR